MSVDNENELLDGICEESRKEKSAEEYSWTSIADKLIWANIVKIAFLHSGYFVSVIFFAHRIWHGEAKLSTIVWVVLVAYASAFGVGGGVHRLWSHRSYKAKWPLRVILMMCYSIAGMNSIFDWVRDHRIHHKYSETDADPHNAKRGFFFSHVGWLMMKKHPECIKRGREIDLSDLKADPIVMFNKKYAFELKVIFCFLIPIGVPVICWGENLSDAIMSQAFMRYVFCLNCVWFVNSVAHLWGYRPYNRLINPAENLAVTLMTAGEGWHNYHHTFPWDYKAAELPGYFFNYTTIFIDTFAKIGWAYDLKQPSSDLVDRVSKRIGCKNGKIDGH